MRPLASDVLRTPKNRLPRVSLTRPRERAWTWINAEGRSFFLRRRCTKRDSALSFLCASARVQRARVPCVCILVFGPATLLVKGSQQRGGGGSGGGGGGAVGRPAGTLRARGQCSPWSLATRVRKVSLRLRGRPESVRTYVRARECTRVREK